MDAPHAESGVIIEDEPTSALDRFQEMAAEGYVAPIVTPAVSDPRSTERRRRWWDRSWANATYSGLEGAQTPYPQMPDDITPGGTTGRSLSGRRRTHRMCYVGDEVALRMPSATAIRRHSTNLGDATFDVPVSAQWPDGRTTQGWVRATRDGEHWHTRALGLTGDDEARTSEAVAAVLEARQVTNSLRGTSDLVEARRRRQQAEGAPITPVHSTWIKGLGYDVTTETMAMTTADRTYGYAVDRSTFNAVAESDSPGRSFNDEIKGQAERVEITACGDCGHFVTAHGDHRCPGSTTTPNPTGEPVAAMAQGRSAVAAEALADFQAQQRAQDPSQPQGPIAEPAEPAPAGPARPQAVYDLRGDLVAKGRQPLRSDHNQRTHFGRRGFTVDVADDLAPFVDPGRTEASGLGYFSSADPAAAEALKSKLPPGNFDEAQNEGPSLRAVLDEVTTSKGRVRFGGYVVGPDRFDERVTCDTVNIYDRGLGHDEAAAEVVSTFGTEPDELNPIRDDDGSTVGWRAWWD